MAKFVVAGGALVLTSELTLNEIMELEKHRPKALVLKDEETKDVYFKVGYGKNHNYVGANGVIFDDESRDGEKKAIVTLMLPNGIGDAVEYVADTYGSVIMNLGKVEEAAGAYLEEIAAEKEAIKQTITVM